MKPDNILFICANERSNVERESCGVTHKSFLLSRVFKDECKRRGLQIRLRVTSSGCLGPCDEGPHAVLMPNNLWFQGFTEDDCSAIMDTIEKNIL